MYIQNFGWNGTALWMQEAILYIAVAQDRIQDFGKKRGGGG